MSDRLYQKIRQAQIERFFPRYTPAWNPVVHLLADLGVGTNAIATRLGISAPNVARWRKPYEDGGRPVPTKYTPELYEMLREAVAVGDEVLAAYQDQEKRKPSAKPNLETWRYNRRAQMEEFIRVLRTARGCIFMAPGEGEKSE